MLNIPGKEKEYVVRLDKPVDFMHLKNILGRLFIFDAEGVNAWYANKLVVMQTIKQTTWSLSFL